MEWDSKLEFAFQVGLIFIVAIVSILIFGG